MKRTNIILLGAFAVAGIALTGCGNSSSEIATINGAKLTKEELITYLEAKPTVRVNIQGQTVDVPVQDTLGFQAMQDLVVRKLLIQMATEEGVLPTKEDVDAEIKLRDEVNPNYVKNLQARGMNMDGIRQQVLTELAQQRLLTKGVTVTDQEVDEFIKANPDQFNEPARVEMLWILTNGAGRAAVDTELTRGRRFADVAVSLSLDPEARTTGGRFGASRFPGGVPVGELNPNIRQAVATVALNKSTDWVQLQQPGQFAKFFVTRRTEARPIEITPGRRELVKRGIAVNRGSEGKDIREEIQRRLREANIEVKDNSLKDLWSNFEENLRKAADRAQLPNANTPAAPAPPTPTNQTPTNQTPTNQTPAGQ